MVGCKEHVSFAFMSQSEAVTSACGEVSQKSMHIEKQHVEICEYFIAAIN